MDYIAQFRVMNPHQLSFYRQRKPGLSAAYFHNIFAIFHIVQHSRNMETVPDMVMVIFLRHNNDCSSLDFTLYIIFINMKVTP